MATVSPVPYAKYAEKVGTPDCPVGYERNLEESPPHIVCQKKKDGVALDEVVRVGVGASAFWIDRWEATIRQNPDGSGRLYDGDAEPYPATFPPNGQATADLYAMSKANERPSRKITWFQALAACAASGKRLANGLEWILAAQGTPPLPNSDGADGYCITNAQDVQLSGRASKCYSKWGARDMHGNLEEWIVDWYAGVSDASSMNDRQPWPDSSYGGDKTYNIASKADAAGAPSAAVRGGGFTEGVAAGIFALNLLRSPASVSPTIGFRCVIPR